MIADDELMPTESGEGIEGEEGGALDTVETVEQPTVQPTVEDLASEMGWRPKEEWKGDETAWKPAHEFVKKTVDVNHKLTSRLKGVEEQLSNMARTSAMLTERALEKEREKIKAERQQAFDEGDADRFNSLNGELARLETAAPPPTLPEETKAFLDRNPWMNSDREAATWAQGRAEELSRQGIGPARQLQIVEREAKSLFPEHFETKPPARPAPLSSPGNRGSAPVAKGFAAMPKDAQAAALDYEKRGVCKKEDYAAAYFDQFGG